MKKIVLLALVLVLLSTAVFVGFVRPAVAQGTIYIRADGSVDPPTANITSSDNITYTFTGNINDEIVVERDNIVVDGAGYTVQGTGASDSKGISLSGSNVTIKNTNIKYFYYGIWLSGASNNSINGNNIANNGFADIWLSGASNNSITANTISESPAFGIHLDYSWNNVIENNTIFNISYPGIDIQLSSNNILRNNTIFDIKEGGIRLLPRSFNNIIEHNSIRRANYDGIELNYADNNTLANNEINDVGYGILMYGSSNNTIVNNNISKGDRGIILYISSENNTICSNTISSFYWGISLHYSSDGNIITNNDIFSYDSSILLDNSSINIVYHNNFVGNDKAYDNGSNQLDYNYWGDYTGLDTDGDGIGDEAYYIYPNGVDNHPLMNPMAFELSQVPGFHPIAYKEIWEEPYVITGEQTIENETIRVSTRIDVSPSSTLTLRNVTLIIESGGWSAGIFVYTGGSLFIYQSVITGKGFIVVAIPNSTFVMRDSELHGCGVSLVESLKILTDGAVVENNLITNSHEGVCIFSSSCRVVNNRILNTFRGIRVENSGNIIMNNTIIGCVEDGIFVYGAVNNTITNNFISDVWRDCIGLSGSSNNSIFGNNLTNDITASAWHGIGLSHSSSNIIYHNNFMDNVGQVYSYNSTNLWDDGYPSGGNYWSDYTGVDTKSGSNQDQPSSDGLGDTPYVIDANNRDRYPLMYPWGSSHPPSYTLTIYSSPTGVAFTVDGVPSTTPWSGTYSENTSVSLVMPETHNGYVWSYWQEDGDPNRIKTVTMHTNITLTAVFTMRARAFWMQWWFWTIVAVGIVALSGAVYFLKKRKPPTPTAPTPPTEGTLQNTYRSYGCHSHL